MLFKVFPKHRNHCLIVTCNNSHFSLTKRFIIEDYYAPGKYPKITSQYKLTLKIIRNLLSLLYISLRPRMRNVSGTNITGKVRNHIRISQTAFKWKKLNFPYENAIHNISNTHLVIICSFYITSCLQF